MHQYNKTPILNTLEEYLSCKPVRMHVPFHTGIANNSVFPKGLYDLDISEVSGYDVEGEDNPIFKSEKITANFFNVNHSFYLTGGASVGLLASLIALNKIGKKIIVSRNVHKSVINGLVLSGLEPIWLEVDFLEEWGVFSFVDPGKLEKALLNEKNLAGCVIVSPTYEGVISNVKDIAKLCHAQNIPLIVDEAHGGYLYFLDNRQQTIDNNGQETTDNRSDSTLSALKCGADLVIQSWHKSLGSLTQSGVLHLVNNDYLNYKDIKRSLDLVSSTSPSFLLLLSLELTRKKLVETNGCYFEVLFRNAMSFKKELKKINGIQVFKNQDPFKIYLKSDTLSGIDFAYELYKEYAVEVESANEIGLLMQIGVNFNDMVMSKVLDSVKNVIRQQARDSRPQAANCKNQLSIVSCPLSPREAFLKGFKKENVEYQTDIEAPCPPGYAISIPGMKIND